MYFFTIVGFPSLPGKDLAASPVVIYHVNTSSFSGYDT